MCSLTLLVQTRHDIIIMVGVCRLAKLYCTSIFFWGGGVSNHSIYLNWDISHKIWCINPQGKFALWDLYLVLHIFMNSEQTSEMLHSSHFVIEAILVPFPSHYSPAEREATLSCNLLHLSCMCNVTMACIPLHQFVSYVHVCVYVHGHWLFLMLAIW